jgi:outer membrane receptor protein involved in Fe transport
MRQYRCVTAGQFGNITKNPANQYNAFFSGNTNLTPESADTYTAGLVLQPRLDSGTGDHGGLFHDQDRQPDRRHSFQSVLDDCLTTANPLTCSKIHRAPGNGSLWLSPTGFVDQSTINIGGLKTSGVDLNGSYSRKIGGIGTLNISMVGTWLDRLATDTGLRPANPTKDGKFDCAGFFGNTCGTPNPEWRHKLRAGFTFANGIGVSARGAIFQRSRSTPARRIATSVRTSRQRVLRQLTAASSRPKITSFRATPRSRRRAISTWLSPRVVGDRYNFRLGANNILDKEPPIVGGEAANAPFGKRQHLPASL